MKQHVCSWTDMIHEQNMLHTHNGILFSLKKEWNLDTWYNMGEPWKYYAKLDKSDTKMKKIV